MDPTELASIIQAVASLVALVAALIALVVTWKAPQRAQRLANELHLNREDAKAKRDEKMRILRAMMKHRGGNISCEESVEAVNLIPLVFFGSTPVLAAYDRFLLYINGIENSDARAKCYIDMIVEIIQDLGYDRSIDWYVVNRGYFPLPDKG